jgi:hypothetical protein
LKVCLEKQYFPARGEGGAERRMGPPKEAISRVNCLTSKHMFGKLFLCWGLGGKTSPN